MPSKYRIILEMASQTARDIASNADRYTDFLITAANNYKYSFKEQLLIHAQKPDATACAEIDTWNKLGRWVRPLFADTGILRMAIANTNTRGASLEKMRTSLPIMVPELLP